MCLGVPGRVLDIGGGELRMGRVAFGEVVKEVSLAFVPEVSPGQFVVVHAGVALDILDEAQASQVSRLLQELDAAQTEGAP